MAHSWVVASIPRRAASGTSLVRSCRGYGVSPGSQVSRLIWLPQRPPWRLGDPTSPLPLSGAPVLTHYPCVSVGGHSLWLCSAPQPVLWPQQPGHHSGKPSDPHFSPALCGGDPQWPCLQVIVLGPHSFSPVAEVAYPTVQLVWPWGDVHMLTATSGAFGTVGWSSGWVTWVKLGVPPGVAVHRDICMRVAIAAGIAESVPSGLKGILCFSSWSP